MQSKTLVIGILGGVAVFGILIGIIATDLLFGPPPKANLYITLLLREVDGELIAVGISGVSGTNPTLVMRNSPSHQMNLRVINQDKEPHQIVIEGLDVSTQILDVDDVDDTIVLSGGDEGSYTYRCALHEEEVFGEFRVVKVSALG